MYIYLKLRCPCPDLPAIFFSYSNNEFILLHKFTTVTIIHILYFNQYGDPVECLRHTWYLEINCPFI